MQVAQVGNIEVLIPRVPHLHHIDDFSFNHTIRGRFEAHQQLEAWSTKPRLYFLLRMLQRDPEFSNAFFDPARWTQANDLWLPLPRTIAERFVSNVGLGQSLDTWERFKLFQACVLSSPFELSERHLRDRAPPLRIPPHKHIESGDEFFDEKVEIDYGASARVFRVRYRGTDNISASKEYPRGTFAKQQENLGYFATELAILRRLRHPHIVELVASFTDESSFGIIMDPAADTSLRGWFEAVATPITQDQYHTLQASFGCLMSALAYLHAENVRHKDIKPGNILLKGSTIYLYDFGISYDWTGTNPTTNNRLSRRTEGYCAPEVMDQENRSFPSDLWSLGRVFCDIITVKQGRSLDDLVRHLGGNMSSIYDDNGVERMQDWLSTIAGNTHDQLLRWITRMVSRGK